MKLKSSLLTLILASLLCTCPGAHAEISFSLREIALAAYNHGPISDAEFPEAVEKCMTGTWNYGGLNVGAPNCSPYVCQDLFKFFKEVGSHRSLMADIISHKYRLRVPFAYGLAKSYDNVFMDLCDHHPTMSPDSCKDVSHKLYQLGTKLSGLHADQIISDYEHLTGCVKKCVSDSGCAYGCLMR